MRGLLVDVRDDVLTRRTQRDAIPDDGSRAVDPRAKNARLCFRRSGAADLVEFDSRISGDQDDDSEAPRGQGEVPLREPH